jgi:hypothetical protein
MALFGSSCRSSLANWAARVLFGCMTRAGRWSRSTAHATDAVLPVPVAPRRTTSCSPARIRRSMSSIAVGWSPEGSNSEITSNGATLRLRSVTGLMPWSLARGSDSPR